MEIKDTYKTIEEEAQGLFKDKGSKFLSFAYPIASEEEVKDVLNTLKKEHHNARHHCYAYRLGHRGEHYRANDDGEPSGTAGRPILGQLLSNELTNTLIIVVRYFGGTLLGVGGLINAYKNAAAAAIEQATVIENTIEEKYSLEFEYPLQNHVNKILKENQIEVHKAIYELNCKLEIRVRLNKEKEVYNSISHINGVIIKKIT